MSPWDSFTDPILRAPTWASLFMSISSSLIGVVLFMRKRSLVSETLSHAAYPGIILGVAVFACWFSDLEEWVFLAILLGAFFSSSIGLLVTEWLEKKKGVSSDAALCTVLSTFFGLGIVAMSALQQTFPTWHRQVQMLLFGQAATMQNMHVWIYAAIALFVTIFFYLVFRPLQAFLFDREYALSIGVSVKTLERVLFFLLLLSLIVGIRSVGIVLVSGMTVAPAVAARQFSDQLQKIFFLSAIFGAFSGWMGNFLSVTGSFHGNALPTGPMIVLSGASIALFSLFFAPKRGFIARLIRIAFFRMRCLEENLLKCMWKKKPICTVGMNALALYRLKRQGWVEKKDQWGLTFDGMKKAASVVRLHRLWELYLTQTLGCKSESVHKNAEEMEHILTPDLEERLTAHLANPKKDPHEQPIPQKSEVL